MDQPLSSIQHNFDMASHLDVSEFRSLIEAAPDAMIIINRGGNIILVNHQTELIFGYERFELLDQPLEMLLPERFHSTHQHMRIGYTEHPHTRPMGTGLELFGKRKDGSEFPVEISLSPLTIQQETFFISSVRDTSERTRLENEFRSLLEATPDAILIINHAGMITLVNHQTEVIFGYKRVELLEHPLEMLLPERFRATHPGHRLGYFDHPHVRPMGTGLELYGRRKDGSEFPVEISLSPLVTHENHLVISSIRDVSDRKLLEQEANQARLLSTIFETIPDGIVVYDRDGRILRTNNAARQLLNIRDYSTAYSLSSVMERASLYLAHDSYGNAFTDDQHPVMRILHGETITTNQATEIQTISSTEQTMTLMVSGAPLHDHIEVLIGAVCVLSNVTEKRKLEQRTQRSLDALLEMAEAMVSGPTGRHEIHTKVRSMATHLCELTANVLGCRRVSITTIDPETEFPMVLAFTGLTPEQEAIFLQSQEKQKMRLRDSPYPELVAQLMAGEHLYFDLTQPPYDTTPNPMGLRDILILPMLIEEHLIGFVTIDYGDQCHSYTPDEYQLAHAIAKLIAFVVERDRLLREHELAYAREHALIETNHRMDAFLSVASHELKTPLTFLKGSVQLAQRRWKRLANILPQLGAEEQSQNMLELLSNADDQIHRLERLVNDILEVSRLQSDTITYEMHPLILENLLQVLVDEYRVNNPNRTFALFLPDGEPVLMRFDGDRIRQVVVNYLTNAIKYTDTASPITIRLTKDAHWMKVGVQDSGPGLAPEEQVHIWERFYRVEHTKVINGSGIGLGLGLYISRMIVTHYGGTTGVESTLGNGATFWFTLPIQPDQMASAV